MLAAKATEDDSQPRVPPPPATPLDFPCCNPTAKHPEKADPSLDLLQLFSNILRTGPSHKHLEALNIGSQSNVSLEALCPQGYLPPKYWIEDPPRSKTTTESLSKTPSKETLSNGGPLPGHEAFYTRVRELNCDNEDAFRTVRRKPARRGTALPRLLHFRKFWENLVLMSEYWDTSLDSYSKSPSSPLEDTDTEDSQTPDKPSPLTIEIDALASEAGKLPSTPTPTSENLVEEETYTGRRKDTGRAMPPKFREETIFSLIEPLTWVFRCRLEHARMQPRVKISGMVLPLPHNGNVYRMPESPALARREILEGPLAAVFVRDQLSFRRTEDAVGDGKQEILDLLREAGLGLMLAQKRAREGSTEDVPGEGMWWATKPRWGGGKGGEMGLSEEEAAVTVEDGTAGAEGKPALKRPKRMNRASAWREVRPPATVWERGVTYLRIGNAKGSAFDDIYLFSALNHHISIVHLKVHHRYIEQLAKQPRKGSSMPAKQPWYKLEMRRSKWYDLLSQEDRVEAMRGIWAVMAFLMRRDGTGE